MHATDAVVRNMRVFSRETPLIKPYELSFTTVKALDSVFCELSLADGTGLGEATALPGYSEETAAGIVTALNGVVDSVVGKPVSAVRAVVADLYVSHPFAASALGTALDFACGEIQLPAGFSIPLIHPVSASCGESLLVSQVADAFDRGFTTIKVKTGRNLKDDMAAARTVLGMGTGQTFRFDANQAYSMSDAQRFLACVNELNGDGFDYLEQPFPQKSWDLDAELNKEYPGQILLDESIYDESDIERTADIGIRLVKLKLAKNNTYLAVQVQTRRRSV